jgi:tRNA/rRNA methyltransferase
MRLHIVLVRTEYARNIGSAARAMSNMGADRLILVDPRCAIDENAKQMAAGAQEKLRERTEYKNWDEFYSFEGEGMRIGFTRRGGRNRKVYSIKEKLEEIADAEVQDLYLIFGPEADGLDHDDLAFVNYACHLPVFGDFASLNLSQAVLLSLYIVRDRLPPAQIPEQVTGIQKPAAKPFYFPDNLIKEWISAMGFDVSARRASAYLTLRRLFLQNRPTKHELHVLESILHQNIRKLKEHT